MKQVPMNPTNPKQQEITRRIEQKVCPVLGEDTDIWLQKPFTQYTYAARTITTMIQVLGDIAKRQGITQLSLWPILTAYLSAKDADEEKDGNLNVVFDRCMEVHLDDMKKFIVTVTKQNGQDVHTLRMHNPDDPNEEHLMRRINTSTIKDLQEKHAIMTMDGDLPAMVGCYFLAGMFDTLAELAEETGHTIMYNLGDVIEVSVVIRKGEPFFRILPGVCAKLTIKQDSFTEKG